MLRNVSLEEISDGKLYTANDMVKADTRSCEGCHACCCHMGDSILLDPLDAHRLSEGLNTPFAKLLSGPVSLTLADGMTLPVLAMTKEKDQCSFLNDTGRCSIHAFRPGFCRLFPLGRFYDGTGFSYFLQTGQCRKDHLSKIKLKQWISEPRLKEYEAFVNSWHYFLKNAAANSRGLSTELIRTLHTYTLKSFYFTPYSPKEDFYPQFYQRLNTAKNMFF